MHRFTASLLAFLGALSVPHRDGRAEPSSAASATVDEKAPTPKEAAAAPAKRATNLGKPAKNEETAADSVAKKAGESDSSKKADGAALVGKKTAASEPSKKTDGSGGGSKKPAEGDAKKASALPSEKGSAKGKAAPAWTKGQPGVVKLVRGAETLEVRVLDRRQRLVPATLSQFAKFLRAKSGADHAIDGRLVTLVATVSDHFGGREVNVVSGFRPYSPGQYSRHSNHNEGRAIDFSIKGIANETVRDFCRTLRNVGVGYYPNSLFVHLDVRDKNTYWVDYAAPGQAPRYHPADSKTGDDDEGDGIASVDDGAGTTTSPSDTPRSDVTRGKTNGRGGDRDSTGERGVFVTR
jgi:uncharacterized protein YcbK (DUF882 family)